MRNFAMFGALFVLSCAILPAFAQDTSGRPSLGSYLASMKTLPSGEQLLAERGDPLAEIIVKPELSIVLGGNLEAVIGREIGVKEEFPFVEGRPLYGWRNHPGLYCDLMRNRGLGSSAACLRDTDGDGAFDKAQRVDFNSGRADVVFITDKQKVRGGVFKKIHPLAIPITYKSAPTEDLPAANLKLSWKSDFKKKIGTQEPIVIEITLTDGKNFTGTEIFSNIYYTVSYTGRPVSVDMYGLQLTVLGFDEEGNLKYALEQVRKEMPVGLVFRGYTFHIIAY